MSEYLLTIVAVCDGISYLYKFSRLMGITVVSKDVLERIENVKDVYDIVDGLDKKQKNDKKPKINKKKYSNKNYMYRLYEYGVNVPSKYREYREKRSVSQALRKIEKDKSRYELVAKMERGEKEKKANEQEEKLYELGYLKDILSGSYVSSDKMLEDIHNGLLIHLSDVKWTPVHKAEFKGLVTGIGLDYEKYSFCFRYAPIKCEASGQDFESRLLKDKLYSIETIKWLKDKRDNVFHDKDREEFDVRQASI